MKKTNVNGEMRPDYDFVTMKGGIRGKYVMSLLEPTVLEPDVPEAFPTAHMVPRTRGLADKSLNSRRRKKSRE